VWQEDLSVQEDYVGSIPTPGTKTIASIEDIFKFFKPHMCLVVNRKERFQVATRGIYVYKVLLYHSLSKSYSTPYQDISIPDVSKGTVLDDTNKDVDRSCKFEEHCFHYTYGGVYHSYTSCPDYLSIPYQCHVFKMKIPKGTEYIVSHNDRQIGAKKLEFVRKIGKLEMLWLNLIHTYKNQ